MRSLPTGSDVAATVAAFAIVAFALIGSTGCGAALSQSVIDCKVETVKQLPADLTKATVGDAVALMAELQRCHPKKDEEQK